MPWWAVVVFLVPGQLVPKPTRTQAISYPIWSTRTHFLVNSYPGVFQKVNSYPKKFLVNSYPILLVFCMNFYSKHFKNILDCYLDRYWMNFNQKNIFEKIFLDVYFGWSNSYDFISSPSMLSHNDQDNYLIGSLLIGV